MLSEQQASNSLHLYIDLNSKLSEIQREFSGLFPFLKIEFFKIPHKVGQGLTKDLIINSNKLVKDCSTVKKGGVIEFSKSTPVSDLELKFFKDFKLSVQVFRKAGRVWLETTATDSWTLAQQNEEGAEFSTPAK
ncbi:MAG: hypothetical protein ACKOX3_10490 [Bacteroidota bacterium]